MACVGDQFLSCIDHKNLKNYSRKRTHTSIIIFCSFFSKVQFVCSKTPL